MSRKDTSVEATSGIYAVRNIMNDKRYIGQSHDLHFRKIHHKSDLKHGRCINRNLQYEYDLFGAECFKFEVLEYCNSDELDAREKYYIEIYNTRDATCGYNFYHGGLKHGAGYTHSEEEINKLKELGIKHGRPIKQLFPDGTYKIWPSITRAKKDLGFSSNGNLYTGIKLHKMRYGCYWEYA